MQVYTYMYVYVYVIQSNVCTYHAQANVCRNIKLYANAYILYIFRRKHTKVHLLPLKARHLVIWINNASQRMQT